MRPLYWRSFGCRRFTGFSSEGLIRKRIPDEADGLAEQESMVGCSKKLRNFSHVSVRLGEFCLFGRHRDLEPPLVFPMSRSGLRRNQSYLRNRCAVFRSFPAPSSVHPVCRFRAVGFQLGPKIRLARPQAIVGALGFAHVHADGSLHASLDPDLARSAIEAGWAISHPRAH